MIMKNSKDIFVAWTEKKQMDVTIHTIPDESRDDSHFFSYPLIIKSKSVFDNHLTVVFSAISAKLTVYTSR